jgi:hypothetical protein
MKTRLLICFTLIILAFGLQAQDSGLSIRRQTTGNAGYSVPVELNGRFYTMQASIGQSSVIGTWESDQTRIHQGFIQPHVQPVYLVEEDVELDVTLFPNPFNDYINLRFEEETAAEIKLFDLSGRLVFSTNLALAFESRLTMPPLAAGMYVIQISSGTKKYQGRIQKLN